MEAKTALESERTVWLAKPQAPQDAESVAVMRWAIEQDARREGTLAAECMAAARAAGLSTEDTYVFLAYQALLRLEEHHMYLSDIAPFVEDSESGRALPGEPSLPGVATLSGVASRLRSQVRNALGRVLHPERPAEPSGPG